MNPRERLVQTFRDHAILHGEFTGTSGIKLPYFIEAQRAILTQPCFDIVGWLLADMCDELKATAIGGPSTGAIAPICAALSFRRGLKGFYYDGIQISGQIEPRDRVLLVDDVLTTGSSLRACADFLASDSDIHPEFIATVVDRSQDPVSLPAPYSSFITAAEILAPH